MPEQPIAAVHFTSDNPPRIGPLVDGPVLTETLAAMEAAKKLPPAVAADVKAQVTTTMSHILGAYDQLVAPGEVGVGGTAKASTKKRIADSPTGLLYGRVQSGKTNAMIVLTAMAIDNGFRVVVVLTSDNVSLVRQTASRFQILQGITIKASTAGGSWLENYQHIEASLHEGGLVLVTAKNSSHMETFIEFLQKIGAGNYPALILDDEADQATLDTNQNKNAKLLAKAEPAQSGSKIYEHHRTMRDELRHHVYLQVTATPYALWLQNSDHPLRPRFNTLLEPGVGYTGGSFFFAQDVVDEEKAPLVFVSEGEDRELVDEKAATPEGLERALSYFLVAAAAQAEFDPKSKYDQTNFLCHTSFKKLEHKTAANKIRNYVLKIRDALSSGSPVADVALTQGLAELARSVPNPPSLESVKEHLKWRLRNFDVFVINSESDELELPPKMNFVVGGNILGRGMTIENLLVTYYLRSAKIAQMDTVLQHARMFGYRAKAGQFLRVFLPQLQALRFLRIQQAEDALRAVQHPSKVVPVRGAKDMKPTRTNVLDASRVIAYHPGEHIFPTLPLYGPTAKKAYDAAVEWLEDNLGLSEGHDISVKKPQEISLDQMIRAIDAIPFLEAGAGSWDPKTLKGVLSASRDLFKEGGFLVSRSAKRTTLSTGMVSGEDLKFLRGLGRPVLGIFFDRSNKLFVGGRRSGKKIDVPFYVYPELILPDTKGMPVHIFNEG